MVYRTLLFLFDSAADVSAALRYGIIAAVAIVGRFVFSIISGTFSHLGAFNTLYNVREQISRHIAMVNLGFFTSHTSGEIKKVIIEDVERIEKFLAHQIPDITSALCVPIIVFIYLLTVNVPMALCLLAPVVLGLVIQGIATVATGRQMPEYHRLALPPDHGTGTSSSPYPCHNPEILLLPATQIHIDGTCVLPHFPACDLSFWNGAYYISGVLPRP